MSSLSHTHMSTDTHTIWEKIKSGQVAQLSGYKKTEGEEKGECGSKK